MSAPRLPRSAFPAAHRAPPWTAPGGPRSEVVIAMDTMLSGVHFPAHTAPSDIGYKALAINLSDLAAMAAEPFRAELSVTLPSAEAALLAEIERGVATLAAAHAVEVLCADITRGELAITVQAYGWVPAGAAVLRKGAKPGDHILVTGTLGDAGLGLAIAQGEVGAEEAERGHFLGRLNRPEPRVAEGLAMRESASAAIDLSDGLAGDLGHLLEASGVGATLVLPDLPLAPAVSSRLSEAEAWRLALGAGDDYELCMTVAPAGEAALRERIEAHGTRLTRVGHIEARAGLRCLDAASRPVPLADAYQHFR